MNLRELINSNARVRKGYPDNEDTYRDFRSTSLGSVIKVDTRSYVNKPLGIIHMIMYMTSAPKQAPIKLFNKRKDDSLTYKKPRVASTYTVAISFSDHWEVDIAVEDLLKSRDETFEKMMLESNEKYIQAKSNFERKAQSFLKRANEDEREDVLNALQEKWKSVADEIALEVNVDNYLRKFANKNARFAKILAKPHKVKREGDMIHVETLITLDDKVRVNCTCSQFFYTFAWYNADHQALIGAKPPAYVAPVNNKLHKLRDKNSVTVRNVSKLPGLCKHLQYFISYLIDKNIIIAKDSRYVKQVYNSESGLNKVKEIMQKSENNGILGNEAKLDKAQTEHQKYLEDRDLAVRQHKLFGEISTNKGD